MSSHERAGQPATDADLVDVAALVTAYYTGHPDVADPGQQVAFGTSGHRGSSFDTARATPAGSAMAVPASASAVVVVGLMITSSAARMDRRAVSLSVPRLVAHATVDGLEP